MWKFFLLVVQGDDLAYQAVVARLGRLQVLFQVRAYIPYVVGTTVWSLIWEAYI